ncbi:MAG: hypothetical protein H7249_20555 [Chitinophagaceae bacterium]|nr:hypothetical protein [Oligoflexus sp.]
MRIHRLFSIVLSTLVTLTTFMGCRTSGEPDTKAAPPAVTLTGAGGAGNSDRILRKSVGALSQSSPENRISECVILKSDVTNLSVVETAITTIKNQALADAFIFRAQIPSIQYFAYKNGEEILVSEMSEKMRFRRPNNDLGNPALDTLMAVFTVKCGAQDATP